MEQKPPVPQRLHQPHADLHRQENGGGADQQRGPQTPGRQTEVLQQEVQEGRLDQRTWSRIYQEKSSFGIKIDKNTKGTSKKSRNPSDLIDF